MSADAKSVAKVNAFHPAFVRENTWESWDRSSMQRVQFNLPVDPEIIDAKPMSGSDGSTGSWEVRFSDGHVGSFDAPLPAQDLWADDLPKVPRQIWGQSQGARNPADITKELGPNGSLRFAYADLCSDGNTRRRYIEAMHVHGLAMVDGMPTEENTITRFCEHIQGFISPSCYGYNFTIKAVEKPNNLAYNSDGVQMHSDLPYYSVPPSIQLFHCLTRAKEGGESIWMDGLDCAATLFKEDPEAFKLLCEIPVRFLDITDDWHVTAEHPIIMLGHGPPLQGGMPHIQRIHFNERARDSWRAWSPLGGSTSEAYYRALRKFEMLVEDRERYSQLLLLPGEMICTDNFRTLHSRNSFKGARHFEGGYMNWDDLYARWRALKPKSVPAPVEHKSKL